MAGLNRRWALLIGADFYFTGCARTGESGQVVHYPSLGGCVNDIELVEVFLKDDVGLSDDDIIKLTCTPDSNLQNTPKESPASWPSYNNILDAFHRIEELGQPGDLVYIHYSGHGARVRMAYSALKGPEGFDEALVPVDIEIQSKEGQSRYIRDVELAILLHSLVKKGLLVTIVLDSCHAGSSNRSKRGATARGTGVLDLSLLPSDL